MAITYIDTAKVDGRFGPTGRGKYYQPVQYHNPNAKGREADKSKWIKTEPDQYCVFKYADEQNWFVEGVCIVGLDIENKKLLQLGTEGERVAIFPHPQNEGENWHGYPIKMNTIENQLDEFFKNLHTNGLISKSFYSRLIHKRI